MIPKRALKKDLKKTSQNVHEDPNVTDSSDLESRLGPRGNVAESLFHSFLDPGGPGDPKWCPKWSPKVPEPPKHRFLTRHGSQMAAQSDVLCLIFQWLWIVGALLSFLFLASLLGCWGSRWSYKRYYKAHGSSNTHGTTAHYHQKNIRVGGMRRQPLKFLIEFMRSEPLHCKSEFLSDSLLRP